MSTGDSPVIGHFEHPPCGYQHFPVNPEYPVNLEEMNTKQRVMIEELRAKLEDKEAQIGILDKMLMDATDPESPGAQENRQLRVEADALRTRLGHAQVLIQELETRIREQDIRIGKLLLESCDVYAVEHADLLQEVDKFKNLYEVAQQSNRTLAESLQAEREKVKALEDKLDPEKIQVGDKVYFKHCPKGPAMVYSGIHQEEGEHKGKMILRVVENGSIVHKDANGSWFYFHRNRLFTGVPDILTLVKPEGDPTGWDIHGDSAKHLGSALAVMCLSLATLVVCYFSFWGV